jgi:hypothetical protein
MHHHLTLLLCPFAFLDCRIYVHGILLQLSLNQYYAVNNHPFLWMMQHSPATIVGENIELGNRLLSQHSATNSRRIDASLLSKAYSHLGIASLNIIKGNRRYEYKDNDPRVAIAQDFLNQTLEDMENGTWQHYPFPEKKQPRVRRKGPKRVAVEEKVEDGDEEYDDDADALIQEAVEVPAEKKKKRQKRSHQADAKTKMQSKMTLDTVECIMDGPWLERLRKWEKSLWKLEDNWKLKLPEGFAEELKAKAPFFAK